MISADLVRALVLVPVAVAGLTGGLPLWGLVVASFALESATNFFAPAYSAMIPALVDRRNVQRANALVQSTTQALSIGGWALAAAFLTFMPVSVFFGVNAASFFVSAALLTGLRHRGEHDPHGEPPQLRAGLAALPAADADGRRVGRRRVTITSDMDRRHPTLFATPPPRCRRLLGRDDRLRGGSIVSGVARVCRYGTRPARA
jgi:hypothetical protein